MIEQDLATIGLSGAAGVGIGFLIGYAMKKVLKLVMVVVGIFFAGVMFLSSRGYLIVNWPQIERQVTPMLNATVITDATTHYVNNIALTIGIPASGGALAGFIWGMTKG